MLDILVDFPFARRQAANLEEQAANLRRMADRQWQGAVDQLSCHWKGESANLYIQKCAQMKQRLYDIARELDAAADTLRRKVQALYEAEQEAKRLAATVQGSW